MRSTPSERSSGLRLPQAFFSSCSWKKRVVPIIHLWLLAVLVLCTVPTDSINAPSIAHLDKLVHAGMYAIPSFLVVLVGRHNWYWFAYLAMFGAMVEVIQAQIGYRSGDLLDLVANICGIILGGLIGKVVCHTRRKD